MPRHRPLRWTLAIATTALVALPTTVLATTGEELADGTVSVLLVSIDALHPDEVDEVDETGAPLAPTLVALRDQGTWWTQARAVMASETLPNHVAMATGTYAGFTGIPGNGGRLAPGDDTLAEPDLGVPEARLATSLIATVEAQCPDRRTVTSLSKEYVWRTFVGEADEDFDQPSANIPGSGHAPEAATVPFILDALRAGPVDHLFANLGDHDRAGHVDATGAVPTGPGSLTGGPRAEQRAALVQVDGWMQSIVQQLQSSGAWERTVLIVVSDHSMNFSLAGDERYNVDVGTALEQLELDAGREVGSTFLFSDNGGAGFVYLVDPDDPERGPLLAAAYAAIGALEGVEELLYREPNPVDPAGPVLSAVHPDWHLHETDRAGDIVVLAAATHRLGSLSDNPLPGNHGHTSTRHATALVTGGWDGVVRGQRVEVDDEGAVDEADDTARFPGQAEQVDWAPTIGWLLGVEDPGTAEGGPPQWRGRVLEEAFTRRPVPVCTAAGSADGERPAAAPAGADGDAGTDGEVDGGRRGPALAATGGGAALVAGVALGLGIGLFVRRRRG